MNILVVDDNTANRQLLRVNLEAENYTVLEAADGVAALRVLESEPVDAVISDILMPNMDGFRFCMEVRKRPRFNAMPFVFYTSTYDSPADRQLAQTVGADRYIVKPAPVATILEALREAAQPGAMRRTWREAGSDTSYVLKQYNESLVAKLEERNIELAVHNEALRTAEKALRESERVMATLLGNLPGCAYRCLNDKDRTLKFISWGVLDLAAYSQDDLLVRRSVTYASLIHPDDRERVWGELQNALEKADSFELVYRIKSQSDVEKWVQDKGQGIHSATGELLYLEGFITDITERRESEEAVRHTEELYRRAITAADAVPYFNDYETGSFAFMGEGIRQLTGYSAGEMTPRLWEGLVRKTIMRGDATGLSKEEAIRRARSGRIKNWKSDCVIRTRDGQERWVADSSFEVLSERGSPRGSIGILMDITERKRGEEVLRESERRVREMLENLSLIAVTLDKNGVVTFCNDYLLRLTGWNREEVVGEDWFSKFIPDTYPAVRIVFFETIEAGGVPPHYENPIKTRAGELREIVWNNTMLRDAEGKIIGTASVGEDVTERKRAEKRLAAHHAITRSLAESGTLIEAAKKILQIICQQLQWDVGGLWTVDRTTKRLSCVEIWHPPSTEFNEFVTLSRHATFAPGEGLTGRVLETGQPEWIAELAQDSNRPRKEAALRSGLRSAIAFPVTLRDEILGVVDFFSAQIHPPDNELLAMFSTAGSQIGQFIERKQLEDQFRQAQKMEAFGQLAGGVAHDFNNILAVIMGYTSLLLENEDLKAGVKEELKQVYSAGERAANLTRQLLTFSRKKEIDVSPLDLNDVIGNITKMLGRVIGEDIKLQANFSPNLPKTEADEGMIEQVLMNLAVNARDAMPDGGGLIVGTDRVIADAAFVQSNPEARAGEFVCLSVRDTGCGMTPEVKARVFEPFFTTKAVGKGTGLGLATVFGIVKQHQGFIEVESQVGVGTTFKVFLPAIPRSVAAPAEGVVPMEVRGGHETILLVEDEAALRSLTRLVLQRHGYRVLEATSGVEALSVWEEHKGQIDLLLTDMVMPEGLTGRDLAKQLRARQPALKVIYVSGYSMDSSGTTFRRRDASTFLQKPYHPRKLAQAIRLCLDQK